MNTKEKLQLRRFLDRVSASLEGAEVEIEIVGAEVGAQIEQQWIALSSISYDDRGDLLTIVTQGHTHRIRRPGEVDALWIAGCVVELTVTDPDGHRYFVKFRRPLVLAAGERRRVEVAA